MKLITNSIDSAASDLQLTILDAADLADSLATKKSSEMSTEVGKPCVQLMNGQSKNTLKENEKLLNGFTKNIQVKEGKEKAVTEREEGEKTNVYNNDDDIYDDDDFSLELPPSPSEEEEREKQKTTERGKDLTNGDDDSLKESASKNEGPSIEIVVEERASVSAPSIVQEIEDLLGLDDTAIGEDELEKEASSTDDKIDNNKTDVDNRQNKTDVVVKLEKHNDDSEATTFCEDSNGGDVAKSVKIEKEQVDVVSSVDDDCAETNLSEVIVSEVIIESDRDDSLLNNSTNVVPKSEPSENTTVAFISDDNEVAFISDDNEVAFISDDNEVQSNDDSVFLAPILNSDDEIVKKFEQPDINSSEIYDNIIEDPLEDPLDTSSVHNDVVNEDNNFGNCSNSISNESEKLINEKEIKDGDDKESEIAKQKEERSKISEKNELLSKQKDKETEEQDENEEEIITLDGDNEVSEGKPLTIENQRGCITEGVQNSVEILGNEGHIASRFVEGTSRKRSVSVNADDDGAYSKRIRLFDESSSDDESLPAYNSRLQEDVATSAVADTTNNSEKRCTEDEFGSDDIKRIRLNNEMLSTCELQAKSSNADSGKTVVESNRLDEDVNCTSKEVGIENSLVVTSIKKEDDAVDEASSGKGIVISSLIGSAEVKCEPSETGEEIKREVVYDLVGFKNTDAETNVTNVEQVKIKVEREDDSVKEADKTNKTVTSESGNDISNKNAEPKITTNKESKLAGRKKSLLGPKKTVSKDANNKSNKKTMRSEDECNKKTASNLDAVMERVVQGAKANPEKKLPLLIKFHKDQLRKLTRTDLEELIVHKLCEAITDRSAIGELRLRCQNLEQINDQWRKKAIQLEKQNRELEMVLKKYLTESANNKRDRHPIPVKVTRSVGLQVILSSAVYGTLENARLKVAENLAREKQQQQNRQTQGQQKQQSVVRNNQNNASQNNTQNKTPSPQVQKRVLNPEVIDLTDKEGDRSKLQQQKQTPQKQKQTPQQQQKQTPQQQKQTPQKQKQTPQQQKQTPQQKQVQQPQQKQVPQPQQKQVPQPQQKQVPQTQQKQVPQPQQKQIPQQQKQTPQVQPQTPPQPQQPQKLQQQQKAQQPSAQGRNATVPNGVRIVPPHQLGANSPQQLKPPMSQNVGSRPPPPPPAININNNTVLLRGGQPIRVQTPPTVRDSPPGYVGNTPRTTLQPVRVQTPIMRPQQPQHPAPLPPTPHYTCKPGTKMPPPKPQLKISKTTNGSGIQLSWSMNLAKDNADIASYQLYAYQEGPCTPNTSLWKKVGDVKALPLPMACTLTQFVEGNKYHFAVRAVDTLSRCGPFSLPGSILLAK